jgi:hypothetical protein
MKHHLLLILLLSLFIFTPEVVVQAQDQSSASTYFVSSDQTINTRSCPRLDCSIVATLEPGVEVSVIETVIGDTAFGSTTWMHAVHNERDIYVHSALLSAAGTQPAVAPATVSTEDWVEYESIGFRLKAPPNMRDFSNDPNFLKYSLSLSDQGTSWTEQDLDALGPATENNIFLVNMQDGLVIIAFAQYTGLEMPLSLVEAYYQPNPGETVLRSEIVETGAGDAFLAHVRTPDATQTEMCLYQLNVDRTDVFFGVGLGLNQEELPALAEAFADSFEITDLDELRELYAEPVGRVRPGLNIGRLSAGQFQLWSYDGRVDDVLTLEAAADAPVPTGPDTRLIVRGPDGQVLAFNDDGGSSDTRPNARIHNLVLPETGSYEIEVHAYPGYTNPAYQLLVETGSSRGDLSKMALAGLQG